MLDVHVLVLEDTPQAWVRQRRDSLDRAVAEAGFPVNVFEVPGVLGHLGQARLAGYAMGGAPYVTYVDDDDWVEPDIFSVLAEHLDGDNDAVFTAEFIHDVTGRTQVSTVPHHLCVYRRPVIAGVPFAELTWAVDIHCRHAVAGRLVAQIDKPVYHYRARGRSAPVRVAAPNEFNPRPFDAEAMPAEFWSEL